MKNSIALIPLVILIFGQLFCEVAGASILPKTEKESTRLTSKIVRRELDRSIRATYMDMDRSNGDGELLEFAETHLFRPVLRYRIRKSSHSIEQIPNTTNSRPNSN